MSYINVFQTDPNRGKDSIENIVETGPDGVLAGNEQGCDFQPDRGFMVKIAERVQHWCEMPTTETVVESIGEGLQVDIGCINEGVDILPWLRADEAIGDQHILQSLRSAGL